MKDVCIRPGVASGSDGRKRSQYLPSHGKSKSCLGFSEEIGWWDWWLKRSDVIGFSEYVTNLKLSIEYH